MSKAGITHVLSNQSVELFVFIRAMRWLALLIIHFSSSCYICRQNDSIEYIDVETVLW